MDEGKSFRLRNFLTTFVFRLSIRWKIALSILVAFAIILPSVSLSLFYFTSLLDYITVITEKDVAVGRMASNLSMTMLDIRRDERNYRMFGGRTELMNVERMIAHADSIISDARRIAPVAHTPVINELGDFLTIYSNSFHMLVDYIDEHPPDTEADQKSRLTKRLTALHDTYRAILDTLDRVQPALRDSVLAWASESLDPLSMDYLGLTADSEQPVYISDNLDRSRNGFLERANDLADRCWVSMQMHKREGLRVEARAKRNIVTMLILTSIACIVMIAYLPSFIVRPVTSLGRIFRKAENGDLNAIASISSNDEIGDLAASYNRMLERLRVYDALKTRKIVSQKRAFDRFLENLNIPACIMTRDFLAVFYNTAFAEVFGGALPVKAPDAGIDITEIEALDPFVESLSIRVHDTVNTFTVDIPVASGGSVAIRGRLVRNSLMELESIVLVGSCPAGNGM